MNQRSRLSQVKAENGKLFMVGTRPCPKNREQSDSACRSPASQWRLRPSRGKDGHLVNLLNTLFVPLRQGDERRGGGMIKNENGKVKTNIPPSGTPFLVAPILGGTKETENGKRKTENGKQSIQSIRSTRTSPLTAPRSPHNVQRYPTPPA